MAEVTDVRPESDAQAPPGKQGRTSLVAQHRHAFTVNAKGKGRTDTEAGHWHAVRRVGQGNQVRYEVGPHQGMLRARVPVYGKLRFLNRKGLPGEGVNVGDEWTCRSYIEGGTLAAAVWTFQARCSENQPEQHHHSHSARISHKAQQASRQGMPPRPCPVSSPISGGGGQALGA